MFLVVVPCENQESALELASKLREHTATELNTVVTPGTIEEFVTVGDMNEGNTDNTLVQIHLTGWALTFYDDAGESYGGAKPVIVLERSRPDGSTVPPLDAPTSES